MPFQAKRRQESKTTVLLYACFPIWPTGFLYWQVGKSIGR